ncbi:hypothetical protein Tco_1412413, partial [Tanacetum coccineum]
GLHNGYDRFQSLLSQLEIYGASVSTEDANQKFLRVFEYDIKGSIASSSSTHNVAFVSSESTSSTNDPIRVYGIAMVDLAVYEVGLRGKVTFWGKELKENDRDDE